MKITLTRTDQDFAMEAKNEEGNTILMDASADSGGHGSGMRPMQLLLAALGGCSSIDVIQILKKQRQDIDSFEVEINGERKKTGHYALFSRITIHYIISGKVNQVKAEKAAKLSMEKYCSVAKSLEPQAIINYKVTIK